MSVTRGGRQVLRWIFHDGAGNKTASEIGAEEDPKTIEQFEADLRSQLKVIEGFTVQMAMHAFKQRRLLTEQRNGERSAEEKLRRLYTYFAPVLRWRLASLNRARFEELYLGKYDRKSGEEIEKGVVARVTRFGGPPSVASQQAELSAAKDFLAWCKRERYLTDDFWSAVKPVGVKKQGATKPFLGSDQTVRLLHFLKQLIGKGDQGAAAVLLAVVTGMRESEVLSLRVQGTDEQFTVVRVLRGKSRKALRPLKIFQDDELRMGPVVSAALRSLSAGKAADAIVFHGERGPRHAKGWLRLNSNRICRLAGLPEVAAHGLRRTHLSLAEEQGATSEQMLLSAGHEARGMQEAAYLRPGAKEQGAARRGNAKLGKVLTMSPKQAPAVRKWRTRGVKVSAK